MTPVFLFFSSKDEKIAAMIDKQVRENGGEVDIIEAEEQAEKDVLVQVVSLVDSRA